jgi:hypothetical protein
MVATHIWKIFLPVVALTSYAAAEECAGGEWDVIVVGKIDHLHSISGIAADIS